MVGTGLSLIYCLVNRGSTGGFLLLRYFSGIVSHPGVLRVSQYVSVESSAPIAGPRSAIGRAPDS